MIVDLKLDSTTWDLSVVDYDLVLVAGVERIKQQILIRLRTFRGECALDTDFGFPWLTDVFKKNPDYATIEALMKAEVLAVPGVTEITAFSSSVNKSTRVWTISLTASCSEGIIVITDQQI
jgi:hypothetical protein